MGKLTWDNTGERLYETGVDHGVLYPISANGTYPKGVAWNGLTGVTESPSGAEPNNIYADNIKYLTLMSAEEFGATIEAYTYPDEWGACDGTAEISKGVTIGQQGRKSFGLSYRTLIGNDTDGDEHGYKLHLVYGGKAAPSERSRQTVNDSPEAVQLSWEVSTTPVAINMVDPSTGKPFKPTSHLEIDSTKVDAAKLKEIEDVLYGTDGTYTATADTSFDAGKTYYELVNGKYVKTTDTDVASGKTYYEATKDTVDARLPLPDEVIAILGEVG